MLSLFVQLGRPSVQAILADQVQILPGQLQRRRVQVGSHQLGDVTAVKEGQHRQQVAAAAARIPHCHGCVGSEHQSALEYLARQAYGEGGESRR